MTSIAEGVARRTNLDETLRVERWHATYNAAITGLHARPQSFSLQDGQARHIEATEAADLMHGALKP